MISAILYSKFPERFLNESILPKLQEKGVVVSKILSPPRAKGSDVVDYDLIIYMPEMSGHPEYHRIKKLTENQGKKLYMLSRKSSSWEGLEDVIEKISQNRKEKMAPPKAVPDSKIDELLLDFIKLREEGTHSKEMISHLKHYWVVGELTNEGQLRQYIKATIERGRCSEALKKRAKEALSGLPLPMKAGFEAVSHVHPVSETKEVTEIDKPVKKLPSSEVKTDLEEAMSLANLYAADVERVQKENEALKAEIDSLKSGKTKSGSVNSEPPEKVVAKAFGAMSVLIDLGLMDASEAFKRLSASFGLKSN